MLANTPVKTTKLLIYTRQMQRKKCNTMDRDCDYLPGMGWRVKSKLDSVMWKKHSVN